MASVNNEDANETMSIEVRWKVVCVTDNSNCEFFNRDDRTLTLDRLRKTRDFLISETLRILYKHLIGFTNK